MNRIDSTDQSFLDRLYKIIEDNLENEQFGVAELAQEVGVSRSQLHRRLHALTGQAASQVIREYRLKKAKQLLENEKATVAEISYKVGFGSPSYFNTCFHDFYGYPPGEAKIRKSIEEKRNPLISKKAILISLSAMILFALIYYSWNFTEISIHKTSNPLSIAVLPFVNASLDSSNIHFVNGLMEDIRNNLSKISELRVIPRSTTEKYRDTKMSASQIGKELGVNYIVEGTVQKLGNQVKIHTQLISAENDDLIWEESYERDISDVTIYFKLRSDIAKIIVRVLNVGITLEEEKNIETIPTSDLTAYDYYLRGEEYFHRSFEEQDYRYAVKLYEQAIEIDPNYTLAWIGLAASSRQIYWLYYDRSEEQLFRIKNYLDKALSLSPNQKEVQIEEAGYYYQCKLNYPKALQILENLKSEYPNDEVLYKSIGSVCKKMGYFNKSFEYYKAAISLNPSNWISWFDAGGTLHVLRKYGDAEKYFKTAIDLNPSMHSLYWRLVALYENTGQLNKAREFLHNNQNIIGPSVYLEILNRNYIKAIQNINSLSEESVKLVYGPSKDLELGQIYHMMDNKEMADKHFESLKVFLLEKIDKPMDQSRLYSSLGIAYAGLGMKKEAIKAIEKALDILSFSNDAFRGCRHELAMARILLLLGEYEDALIQLDFIISKSGFVTADVLKLDPFWDPVREMDKFKAIINNPEYQVNPSEN